MSDARDLEALEVLFREGDPSDGLVYIVNTGKLAVSRSGIQLGELSQGDVIGEMSLLMDEPRSATVSAVEDSTVLCLDQERLLDRIARTPQLSLKIMRGLAARLQATNEKLAALSRTHRVGLAELQSTDEL